MTTPLTPSPDPSNDSSIRTDATDTRSTGRMSVGRRSLIAVAAGVTVAAGGLVTMSNGSASAIVDGEPTTSSANPWQVALMSGGQQFCGGSLVSDRVVVTAAHCTVGTDAADMQILAGAADLTSNDGQTVQVAQVIEHPTYAGGSADIAMLVLADPVSFNDQVAAIPVATADEAASATEGRVTGWGDLSETGGESPTVLQTADVPLVGDGACDTAVDGIDAANELCAGGTGTDSCYGDSGGPLTIETDRGRVLAGVTSWGLECGGESPGVYAEVPTFSEWIAERVADPDAPAPERPDVGDMDEEFFDDEFDEELPEGVEIDDEGYVVIPDAFFDEYGDDHLDSLSDDEFWNLFIEWSGGDIQADHDQADDDQTGDQSGAEADPAVDGDGANESAGDAGSGGFDFDAIDAMSDDEFDRYINDMSNEEFDRFLDAADAAWGTIDEGHEANEGDDMTDAPDSGVEFDDADLDDTDWDDMDWDAEFDDADWDAEFECDDADLESVG